jgi:VWFA-related protein
MAMTLLAQDEEPVVIRVDVQMVRVPVSVQNENGKHIAGLRAEDFQLLDNGAPRPVRQLWTEGDLPLHVGLVLDVSDSQMVVLRQNLEIMRAFLKGLLREQDRAFLAAFTGQVRLFQDFTADGNAIMDVAAKIHTKEQVNGVRMGADCKPIPPPRGLRTLKKPPKTCGGSAIWHAMFRAVEKLKGAPDTRKAIILITDGQDTGSNYTAEQVIAMAQSHGIPVYAIGVHGRTGRPEAELNDKLLKRLGAETGGVMFEETEKPVEIFERINLDLRSQYVLGFSPAESCDGKFHALQVTARDYRVRTRTGYQSGDCSGAR